MFRDSDRRDKKIKADSEKLEFHKSILSTFAASRWPPKLPFILFVAVWVALVFIELHAQRVGHQLPNLGILCRLHHVGHDLADLWIEELFQCPFLSLNA